MTAPARRLETLVPSARPLAVVRDASPVLVDLTVPGQERVELEPVRQFLLPGEGLLGAPSWQRAVKRLIDLAVTVVAIALISPVLATVALLVWLSSPGPVFFAQDRVGCDGRRFRFLKFRTMYRDAESRRQELIDLNEVDGPVFKIRRDPRITPIGRMLRKLSLDELPQLFHVLSGRMSIVGPRPPLPEEVARYGTWESQRLLVKPGLTCIWQVSGRSDLDFGTWVAMDVDYIRRWSLLLDLKLMAHTIPAVLSGRGAY